MQYEGRKEDDSSSIRQANGCGLFDSHSLAEVEASAGGDPRRDAYRHILADTGIILEDGATKGGAETQENDRQSYEEKRQLELISENTLATGSAPITKTRKARKTRRTGQIIERGERVHLVRVYLGRDDTTGKRRYTNKTIHGTKKDAQMWLNATLREIDLGIYVEPAGESVNAYLDKWLDAAAKPRLRQRTFEDYTALLRRYVRDEIGHVKLSMLRPLDIQQLYSKMQMQGLSARVVRYTHAVLSSALKQAVQWGMISRNPAQLVQLPKQTRKEMHALSSEEVSRFLSACKTDRYGILFAFAITTGMRPEEYFALQWKDIDLEHGNVIVRRVLVRLTGGGWRFEEPKTARSRRNLPIPATMKKQLVQHRRSQLEEQMRIGSEYNKQDFVFATETGEPLMLQNLSVRHFKPALKNAGLSSSIRLYDLRHTCATLLLMAGENPKVVSERLGHASITLTLDTYSHVLPGMQKAAAEKLENLVFATVRTP